MNDVLNIVAWGSTIVGVLVIIGLSFHRRQKIHANEIASFATTSGILFTFLGIVLAL